MSDRQYRISRRSFLASTTIGITALAGCNNNSGQVGAAYPSESLSCIVPFGQGGGTDTYARQIMPKLSEVLDVSVAIRNAPGASSLKGTGELVQTESDGYSFGVFNPPSTPISYLVYQPSWDIRSLVPVCTYGQTPYAVFARSELGVEGLRDLVERYRTDELSIFSGLGRGGIVHVAANVMRTEYNLEYDRYVSYGGGGPAIRAAVSGEVPIVATTDTAASGAVASGDLEPITILSSRGSSIFPDAPSPSDEGFSSIDYIGQLTRCMFLPPGTDTGKRATLEQAVQTALQKNSAQKWAKQTGNTVEFGDHEAARNALKRSLDTIQQRINIDEIMNGDT
ncbi:Bug family tripartite tricarboxylate transporter substrate binding protein [Halocatena salina]|uniref:Tripartite tricarboxylate transporter substrate binding protein n=1 Tax=Halocatena salina TaxID=2934340 RepID=A0A8U0A6K4_9EURY|nr:tripartite tricarboxylate transporter substrate-binding protein [Halocatena salina]UPM44496.1 tripartite tricarboxylate transporter substrate binding protein [Halocatena salina]